MTVFERLLNTGYHLDVFKVNSRIETSIGVRFPDSEIKDGAFLVSDCGRGQTLEEACEDYIRKISGKTVVFHASSNDRTEVIFI